MKKLILLLAIFIGGCSTTPTEYIDRWNEPDPVVLFHPQMPYPPANPNVDIKVITVDTIKPDVAYVGFEYDQWLKFAAWMHEYRAYNKKLIGVIDVYKEQGKQEIETEEKSMD